MREQGYSLEQAKQTATKIISQQKDLLKAIHKRSLTESVCPNNSAFHFDFGEYFSHHTETQENVDKANCSKQKKHVEFYLDNHAKSNPKFRHHRKLIT